VEVEVDESFDEVYDVVEVDADDADDESKNEYECQCCHS
jgi:hypothetical protein